jgi:hypothetical protein
MTMNANSEPTPESLAERVLALKRRYAYQFSSQNLGHNIEPGWIALVEQACTQIDRLLPPSARKTFHWRQIKEKFGGLRLYYAGGPVRIDIRGADGLLSYKDGADRSDAIREVVDRAEAASMETCAICAEPGELRTDRGWIRTLCDRHATEDTSAFYQRYHRAMDGE